MIISKEFGLFITLLLVSAQRNETIRTLKFSDFFTEKKGRETKYLVSLFSRKTRKHQDMIIPKDIYDHVIGIQLSRQHLLKEVDHLRSKDNIKAAAQIEKKTTQVFYNFIYSRGLHEWT